ncbi:sensor histidine kinase [Actinophytocola gossypii]|uniref:histidine kinase n=1 Tax=Actinophytocola gossypii TaxID=2812003 RepID=A0ABT2JD54_9PSEU|nr:sensor histidine kinase [Actinophytocola gossypii]MCT2585792.1 sensor histidine kinase [Actinophytocola gossypii]
MTSAGPQRTSQGPLGGLPPFALVIPVAFVQVIGTYPASIPQEHAQLNALTYVLVLAGPPMLLLRRSRPLLTLYVTVAITVLYAALRFPIGPVFLSAVIAAFNAGLHAPRLVAWVSSAVSLGTVTVVLSMTSQYYDLELSGIGFGVAWLALILGLAEIIKARHDRAEQAVRALEEQGRRLASEERLKIAREVHDVLAHHVSLINVQSGVALHLIDEQPEQARQALSAIKQSSKEVLVELRNILGVLKDANGDADGSAPRQPVASLDQLDRLLERMREAGLPVSLEVTGEHRQLPSGVDAAALRIVQESLTNTYRHAGPTQATVRLGYLPGELSVEVLDNGRGGAHAISAEGTGSGLTGMRQRAEALGGTLTAGPRPGGGFLVAATLPTGSTGGIEDES